MNICGVIYRIVNVINGKCYYGSTINAETRWKTHIYSLKKNKHHNIHLQRSWNKYGEDNFIFEIVEIDIPKNELFLIEQNYINKNIDGYNLGSAGGGDNITNHPNKNEIIEKRSKKIRENVSNLSEHERKIKWGKNKKENPRYIDGRSYTGKKCKMCDNVVDFNLKSGICYKCRDRKGNNNPFYGKFHNQETKDKISKANTGRIMSDKEKESITGKNNGRYMGTYHTPWGIFPSSSQAEKNNTLMKSAAIHRLCLNPDNIIQRIGNSKFLQSYGSECVGKTYRDLGFWFEPKQP
jgi:group I intron endonuclease